MLASDLPILITFHAWFSSTKPIRHSLRVVERPESPAFLSIHIACARTAGTEPDDSEMDQPPKPVPDVN